MEHVAQGETLPAGETGDATPDSWQAIAWRSGEAAKRLKRLMPFENRKANAWHNPHEHRCPFRENRWVSLVDD